LYNALFLHYAWSRDGEVKFESTDKCEKDGFYSNSSIGVIEHDAKKHILHKRQPVTDTSTGATQKGESVTPYTRDRGDSFRDVFPALGSVFRE
jgi:hypothetical protein